MFGRWQRHVRIAVPDAHTRPLNLGCIAVAYLTMWSWSCDILPLFLKEYNSETVCHILVYQV